MPKWNYIWVSQLKKSKLRLLAEIYFTFLKLGSVSFGGGYAMISLIEREIVNEKKWVEKEKIIDIFAVSESLPGAIALNSSAFVGFSIAGIPTGGKQNPFTSRKPYCRI